MLLLKRLEQVQKKADKEVLELKATQKVLVEKNLSRIYSDVIFKEQNDSIERKLTEAQLIKESTNIKDYDVDKVVTFTKTLLADLGETYKRSNVPQIKLLLGSMFPSGLHWTKNATLNHELSPACQRLVEFSNGSIPFGVN